MTVTQPQLVPRLLVLFAGPFAQRRMGDFEDHPPRASCRRLQMDEDEELVQLGPSGLRDRPTLGPVHRLAFRSRTKLVRNTYLTQRLAGESEYNETLFNLCKLYQEKYDGEYSSYKNALAEEAFMQQDWTNMTKRQQLAIVLHQPTLTTGGRAVALLSTAVAVGSTITLMLQTLPEFNPGLRQHTVVAFNLVEGLVTLYFTVESVTCFATHPRRLEYVKTLTFWVDLVSTLPLYLLFFFGTFLPDASAYVDPIRMTRLFRIGKYMNVWRPVKTLASALSKTLTDLSGPLFFLTTCCMVFANALYYAQRGTWDESRGGYVSPDCLCEDSPKGLTGTCPSVVNDISAGIPRTTWWGFVTLLTVGFGDIVPQCAWGRVIAAVGMITSSIVMAMPVAVLGEAFQNEAGRVSRERSKAKVLAANLTVKEHERVVQLASARRLNEVRPNKLLLLTRRAGLPLQGQPHELVARLYRLFGIDPRLPPTSDATIRTADFRVPAVLALGEAFLEYVRLRTPFEIVDLKNPAKELLTVIDTFFERVFAWWTRTPARHLQQRMESSDLDACLRIVPLVTQSTYTIGIEVGGVPPPDIVLPRVAQVSPSEGRVAFGPRMATLRVILRFGMIVYILIPEPTFRALVNGTPIDGPVELKDRDTINFGSSDVPLMYTLTRLDEYAYGHSASRAVDVQLPTRLWVAQRPIDSLLSPTAGNPVPLRPGRGSPLANLHLLQEDVHHGSALGAPITPRELQGRFVL
jgi:voltage-gated potassium channel